MYRFTVTTATNQGNCSWTDSVFVSNDQIIRADFSWNRHFGCGVDTILFKDGSMGSTHWRWKFGDGQESNEQHPSHQYRQSSAPYPIQLLAWNNHCSDSVTKTINLERTLQAAFRIGQDTLCQGDSIAFINTSTASFAPYRCSWDLGNSLLTNNCSPRLAYPLARIYKVVLRVTDSLNCMDSAQQTVVVKEKPLIGLHLDRKALCVGENIKLNGLHTGQEIGPLSWSFGDGQGRVDLASTSHAYDHPGLFHVYLSYADNICALQEFQDSVTVFALPTVDLGGDTTICPYGLPLLLHNRHHADSTQNLLWSTGARSEVLKVTQPGTYSLTVTNTHNCVSKDEVSITKVCAIDLPNSFTPNGDGINDFFAPQSSSLATGSHFQLSIYNRWGQLLFRGGGRGWDGRFNDQIQPAGVYIYSIEMQHSNGVTEKQEGNLTLLH